MATDERGVVRDRQSVYPAAIELALAFGNPIVCKIYFVCVYVFFSFFRDLLLLSFFLFCTIEMLCHHWMTHHSFLLLLIDLEKRKGDEGKKNIRNI